MDDDKRTSNVKLFIQTDCGQRGNPIYIFVCYQPHNWTIQFAILNTYIYKITFIARTVPNLLHLILLFNELLFVKTAGNTPIMKNGKASSLLFSFHALAADRAKNRTR